MIARTLGKSCRAGGTQAEKNADFARSNAIAMARGPQFC